MHMVGVTAAGGPALFSLTLPHGADPHRLVWDLGYRLLRPLSASGIGDDLVVTLQVTPHGRDVPPRPPARTRTIDSGLKISTHEPPVPRQRLAAYAIVLSERGILATEFSDRTAIPGLWGLPGGGIDEGENPAQTVQREALEETGQEIELSHVLDLQTDHWIGRSPTGTVEDFHAVRIIYSATCLNPTAPIVNDSGGTTSATQWVNLAEWEQLRWAAGSRHLLDRHLPVLLNQQRHD